VFDPSLKFPHQGAGCCSSGFSGGLVLIKLYSGVILLIHFKKSKVQNEGIETKMQNFKRGTAFKYREQDNTKNRIIQRTGIIKRTEIIKEQE